MITDTAERIAMRIREIWGATGPAISAWTSELGKLDETAAFEALDRLKMTADRCPSIARFYAVYFEVRRETTDKDPACPMCEGAGWLEAPDLFIGEHRYSKVDRCGKCGGSGKFKSNDSRALGGSR